MMIGGKNDGGSYDDGKQDVSGGDDDGVDNVE